MKIKEFTLKKGYSKKLTTKDASGSYDSTENASEVTITFEGTEDMKEAKELVRRNAQDLLDDDYPFIKKTELEKEDDNPKTA